MLGVAANASAAEIRAAYLTLMRVHHPDRNPSPESVERAKGIIAAFKVLSDFDQRSHYDWDRRRDRERAAALVAPDRTLDKKAALVGVVGAGLVIAAMAVWPTVIPGPDSTIGTPQAGPAPLPGAAEQRATAPAPAPREETLIRMRPVLPEAADEKIVTEPLASSDPPRPAPVKATSKPVRLAKVASEPRPEPKIIKPSPPVLQVAQPKPPVRVAAKSAPVEPEPRQPTARPATDIASLDQFVMNFYGQSWRYGDASKRAVLERTRASFVARRGACAGDSCRRNAYLDLMRDVSSIVETGKPEPR
jgi:curved DNA-binding protein CbpA